MEMIYLSKAQQYFDDLISQGYPKNEALDYTQKYYPGFFLTKTKDENKDELTNVEPNPNAPNSPYIPSNQEESFSDKYGPKAKMAMDSTMRNAKILFEKLSLDRKTAVIASSVVVVLLISVIAFLIPSSTGPINGTWIKADGQKLSFDSDGDYDDQSSLDSIWELDGNDLTIISSGTILYSDGSKETIEIVQDIDVYFSDDENALWLDFNSVKQNGEELLSDNQQCVLILKNNIASNILEYSNEYSEYLDETPKQCN